MNIYKFIRNQNIINVDMKTVLLLFDIDGTITDTTKMDDTCFKETIWELFNIDLENIEWNKYPNVTDSGLSESIYKQHTGRSLSKGQTQKIRKLFYQKIKSEYKKNPNGIEAIAGVNDFIESIRQMQIPMAIATGGFRKTAEFKLTVSNIPYTPFTLATSNDAESRRSIMNIAIARAQFEYQQFFKTIVYFGDGVWDVQTCRDMDIPMIGIDCNFSGKLDSTGIQYLFHDYLNDKEIFDAIKQIHNNNERKPNF